MLIPKAILPREHGAWGVLFIPLAVGAFIAGNMSWNILLLAFSTLGVFMASVPLQLILRHRNVSPQDSEKHHQSRRWATVHLAAGSGFLIPLLLQGYTLLLIIGAFGVAVFVAHVVLVTRYGKSIATDMLALAGLALSVLSAYYVGTHTIDLKAIVLWILNVLFFGCSVVYVHMKMKALPIRQTGIHLTEKLSIGKLNILYHIGILCCVPLLALLAESSQGILMAFLPMVVHAVYGTFQLSRRVRFKRLGFILLGYSIWFGMVLSRVIT
jgi:hypothetical protein